MITHEGKEPRRSHDPAAPFEPLFPPLCHPLQHPRGAGGSATLTPQNEASAAFTSSYGGSVPGFSVIQTYFTVPFASSTNTERFEAL